MNIGTYVKVGQAHEIEVPPKGLSVEEYKRIIGSLDASIELLEHSYRGAKGNDSFYISQSIQYLYKIRKQVFLLIQGIINEQIMKSEREKGEFIFG